MIGNVASGHSPHDLWLLAGKNRQDRVVQQRDDEDGEALFTLLRTLLGSIEVTELDCGTRDFEVLSALSSSPHTDEWTLREVEQRVVGRFSPSGQLIDPKQLQGQARIAVRTLSGCRSAGLCRKCCGLDAPRRLGEATVRAFEARWRAVSAARVRLDPPPSHRAHQIFVRAGTAGRVRLEGAILVRPDFELGESLEITTPSGQGTLWIDAEDGAKLEAHPLLGGEQLLVSEGAWVSSETFLFQRGRYERRGYAVCSEEGAIVHFDAGVTRAWIDPVTGREMHTLIDGDRMMKVGEDNIWVPPNAQVCVRNGDKVSPGQILWREQIGEKGWVEEVRCGERLMALLMDWSFGQSPVFAKVDGRVRYTPGPGGLNAKRGVVEICPRGAAAVEHWVGDAEVGVVLGQEILRGTQITAGRWSPAGLFGVVSVNEARRAVVEHILRLFAWGHAPVEDVFAEVLVRAMTREGRMIGVGALVEGGAPGFGEA